MPQPPVPEPLSSRGDVLPPPATDMLPLTSVVHSDPPVPERPIVRTPITAGPAEATSLPPSPSEYTLPGAPELEVVCEKEPSAWFQLTHLWTLNPRCHVELGASAHAAACVHVYNGIAARMVFYHYDFNDPAIGDPAQLNYFGQKKLDEIVRRLPPEIGCPVVVESTRGNPQLDACRQACVATTLQRMNMPLAVVVGDPPRGFRFDDAMLIHESLLQQTRTGGMSASSTFQNSVMSANH